MLELGVERFGLGLVDEVAVLAAPGRDRVGHPIDDLLQRRLALGRPQLSPEVLLGDDVGRVLRPPRGELDVGLLEGDGAIPEVGDAGVSPCPHHIVVRVDPLGGEVPADTDTRLLRGNGHAVASCCSAYRHGSYNHKMSWLLPSGGTRSGATYNSVIPTMSTDAPWHLGRSKAVREGSHLV